MATNENLPAKVIKELARELKSLDESPPADIRVLVNEDNFSNIYADIEGPFRLHGRSMRPTFNPDDDGTPGHDVVLVEKFCLRSFNFSRGDVVAFRSPQDPKEYLVKRLIALQEDWITVPGTYEILQIPRGHCWVEGDNVDVSLDSKEFGPIPLALMRGRVTHVVWPLKRVGQVQSKFPTGRVFSKKEGH